MPRPSMPALAVVLLATSISVAKPPAQREAQLRAISLVASDGGASARAVRVTARVAKNKTQTPSVGIFGASARAGGDQWLPSLWRAAFVASEATDSSLLDSEFSLHVEEAIDGPSAGMLLAATLTALLRNKPLLPLTTMTGALNPDGSIGPVEDVLARLRAAGADGVKRFGIPSGNRQQLEGARSVDLVAEGERLGVVVKELGSLDDAYTFLTGDSLQRPAPAKEADMELWPAELAALAKSTAQVRSEFDAERPELEKLLERVNPGSLASVRQRLDRATKQATDFEQSGDAVRALVVWSSALTMTRVAKEVASLDANDGAAIVAKVQAHDDALVAERLAFRHEIDAKFPNSNRANDLYAMDLLESVAPQGAGLPPGERATKLRALAPKDPAFVRLAKQYVEELARGREDVKNGKRFFEMYAALPKLKQTLPALDAERLAALYAAAGAASYAALQARLTDALAKDETALELAGSEALIRSETDARARLVLAARQGIYSAHLLNTSSALGASVDASGVFTVRNARALSVQLELARLRILQSCGRSKREAAMIPFAARMRFLNARAAREGTDRQKTESLAELWIGSWWCELAVDHAARAKAP